MLWLGGCCLLMSPGSVQTPHLINIIDAHWWCFSQVYNYHGFGKMTCTSVAFLKPTDLSKHFPTLVTLFLAEVHVSHLHFYWKCFLLVLLYDVMLKMWHPSSVEQWLLMYGLSVNLGLQCNAVCWWFCLCEPSGAKRGNVFEIFWEDSKEPLHFVRSNLHGVFWSQRKAKHS